MAESAKTEIMMLVIPKLGGPALDGECLLQIQTNPQDDLMTEFVAAPTPEDYSNFFELTGFSLGMKLEPNDATGGGGFRNWYQFKKGDPPQTPFPRKFDKGSFDRVIDAASPVFFHSCCNKKKDDQTPSFDKAIIIKRALQGDAFTGGTGIGAAYIRIELTGVDITSISWDDGDVVKEKCDFTATGITVTYRAQHDSGAVDQTLGDQTAHWDITMETATKK